MAKNLVLLDSHAILHRAYHSLPKNLTDRKGHPINAVYGFARMIFRILDELRPDYLLAAFDLPAPTFRHQAFMGYQAQRPKMEDDLSGQIEAVKQLTDVFSIPRFEKEGFEADDLIGTLACQGEAKKMKVRIVTGDKDILQLVTDRIGVYLMRQGLSRTEIVDRQGVKRILGVWPKQVVDYKALVGDSADNYPGVPGIGPKTAEVLLERYASLEKIYAHLDELPEKVAIKLRENHPLADLSYRLAKIETKAPVKLPEQIKDWRPDEQKAGLFLTELGFKSLTKRLTQAAERHQGKEQLRLV